MAVYGAYDSWQDDVDGVFSGVGQYLGRNVSSIGLNAAYRGVAEWALSRDYSGLWQSRPVTSLRSAVGTVGRTVSGASVNAANYVGGRVLASRVPSAAAGFVTFPGYRPLYRMYRAGLLATRPESLSRIVFPKMSGFVSKVTDRIPGVVKSVAKRVVSAKGVPRLVVSGNKIIGNAADAMLPRLTASGVGHTALGKLFTSRGAALGFAIGGVSDAVQALHNNDFDYDSLGWKYVDGWKLTKNIVGRTLWGTARALDSALFGLPGLIPGVGSRLNSDDYLNPEVETSAFDEDFYKKLATASKEDALKLARERDAREREMLKKGKDIDGNTMYTIGADGKPREFTEAEGAAQVKIMDAAKERAADERRLMMVDDVGRFRKDVDTKVVRHGLGEIDKRFNSDLEQLYRHYDNFEAFKRELNPRVASRPVMEDRDRWLKSAEANLISTYNRRRQQIVNSSAYADLVGTNRESALGVYRKYAAERGLDDGAAVSRFTDYWDSQDDWYRENTDGQKFMADLISASRESQSQSVNNGVEEG